MSKVSITFTLKEFALQILFIHITKFSFTKSYKEHHLKDGLLIWKMGTGSKQASFNSWLVCLVWGYTQPCLRVTLGARGVGVGDLMG